MQISQMTQKFTTWCGTAATAIGLVLALSATAPTPAQARTDVSIGIGRPLRFPGHEAWMKHAEVKSASRAQDAKGLAGDRGKIRRVHQRHARDRGVEAVVCYGTQLRR